MTPGGKARCRSVAGQPPGHAPTPEEWPLASHFGEADASKVAEAGAEAPSRAGRARRNALLAVAASVLLCLAAGIAWYVWPTAPSYSTPVGGLASVPLSDGSKVTLNTDSQIRIEVTETERRVELQQGEAFFEVASDPTRPFVVVAGSKRVIAVGTAFSVRRNGDDVRVTVTEGQVRIEDTAETAASGDRILLSAGSVARATEAGILVQQRPVPELQNELSWRTGYLIFRDMPLAEAVAAFNRYNTRKIVIDDPDVAAIRISGKFRSTQYEAFVRLLQEGFPIRAISGGDSIVLTGTHGASQAAVPDRD